MKRQMKTGLITLIVLAGTMTGCNWQGIVGSSVLSFTAGVLGTVLFGEQTTTIRECYVDGVQVDCSELQ
jgi:hypothetical protein